MEGIWLVWNDSRGSRNRSKVRGAGNAASLPCVSLHRLPSPDTQTRKEPQQPQSLFAQRACPSPGCPTCCLPGLASTPYSLEALLGGERHHLVHDPLVKDEVDCVSTLHGSGHKHLSTARSPLIRSAGTEPQPWLWTSGGQERTGLYGKLLSMHQPRKTALPTFSWGAQRIWINGEKALPDKPQGSGGGTWPREQPVSVSSWPVNAVSSTGFCYRSLTSV